MHLCKILPLFICISEICAFASNIYDNYQNLEDYFSEDDNNLNVDVEDAGADADTRNENNYESDFELRDLGVPVKKAAVHTCLEVVNYDLPFNDEHREIHTVPFLSSECKNHNGLKHIQSRTLCTRIRTHCNNCDTYLKNVTYVKQTGHNKKYYEKKVRYNVKMGCSCNDTCT